MKANLFWLYIQGKFPMTIRRRISKTVRFKEKEIPKDHRVNIVENVYTHPIIADSERRTRNQISRMVPISLKINETISKNNRLHNKVFRRSQISKILNLTNKIISKITQRKFSFMEIFQVHTMLHGEVRKNPFLAVSRVSIPSRNLTIHTFIR